MRLLAMREHSRNELARKLSGHEDAAQIETLLDRLVELDLLSDTRFAESYVRGHAARFGRQRLRHELARRGVAEALIEQAIDGEAGPDEFARARAVWKRKYTAPPAGMKEWARQARFLQSRGFSTDIIRQLLKDPDHEPA